MTDEEFERYRRSRNFLLDELVSHALGATILAVPVLVLGGAALWAVNTSDPYEAIAILSAGIHLGVFLSRPWFKEPSNYSRTYTWVAALTLAPIIVAAFREPPFVQLHPLRR